MVKVLGKEAAKKFIQKEVLTKLKDELEKLGLKFAGSVFAGEAASKIVGALVDPGKAFANWLDSIDKIPKNGYLEAW